MTPRPRPDGSFTYVPATDFTGDVTFRYLVRNASLASEPHLVTLRVAGAVGGDDQGDDDQENGSGNQTGGTSGGQSTTDGALPTADALPPTGAPITAPWAWGGGVLLLVGGWLMVRFRRPV
ncbi:hypothetical protein [Nocardioides sp. AE5]|uniref:hypothetical protein n=1 Tax=Nocardioides sp. AE5 TaxID=2962573 RepID=UPI0037C8B1CC